MGTGQWPTSISFRLCSTVNDNLMSTGSMSWIEVTCRFTSWENKNLLPQKLFFFFFSNLLSCICSFLGSFLLKTITLPDIPDKVFSKLIGFYQRDWCFLWESEVVQKTQGRLPQQDHIPSPQFIFTPSSGKCFPSAKKSKNRLTKPSVPSAIGLLNLKNFAEWRWGNLIYVLKLSVLNTGHHLIVFWSQSWSYLFVGLCFSVKSGLFPLMNDRWRPHTAVWSVSISFWVKHVKAWVQWGRRPHWLK